MNRRDAITIIRNRFKLTEAEAKDFDKDIQEVANLISLDNSKAMLHHSTGGRFFLTLISMVQTEKGDEIDVDIKEVEAEFYFESLNKVKQNDD